MLITFTVTDTMITAITYFENGSVHRTDEWPTQVDIAPVALPGPPPIPYYTFEINLETRTYDIVLIIGQDGANLETSNIVYARYPLCKTIFYDERDYSEPPPAP